MTIRTRLETLLSERILVLDGAMGTMIQRHKLTEADFRGERLKDHPKDQRGNSDILILTRPDVISSIHHEYLAAGADIIETNTFSSTAIAQSDYALESYVYELNLEGARLAKAAASEWTAKTPDQPRFAAGSMGPMNRTLSISPDVNDPSFRGMTFDQAREAYEEQVRGLMDGGVDLLPIGHLLKNQVRGVARELGVPEAIIDKAPAAGLWPGQTDEEEMGFSYADLERYLTTGPEGVSPALALRLERVIRSTEHKRTIPPHPES